MNHKKSLILLLSLLLILSLALVGCQSDEPTEEPVEPTEEETTEEAQEDDTDDEPVFTDGTYTKEAEGYGGPLTLTVTVEDGTLTDMVVDEHQETMPVYNRAMPVITERIMEAQSPEVDSVSGATYTSFAVKRAVGEALNEAGANFDEVTIATTGPEVEKKDLPDEETSLVIVGGGPAGLSAAIEAHNNGVDELILLEKLDILGGNGKFDMIIFDAINTQAQEEMGYEYTKEEFIAKKDNVMDSDDRIEAWADGAYELDEWFRSMGIELNHTYDGTSHMAEADGYAGEEILDGLEATVDELGLDVRRGSKVVDLIMEDGVCKGVTVETKEGNYDILADATIVATGGFSQNPELLEEYAPGAEIVRSSNQMGAEGDLVPVFIENDFKMANMDNLNIFNPMLSKNRELSGARGDGYIIVNNEGNRFFAENTDDRMGFAHAILDQPDGEAFYIYDQPVADSFYRMEKHINLGYHEKADTIEELAEKLGIDADNLETTIENYNKAIEGEQEDEFRDEMIDRTFAEEGPYYGFQMESAIHMTFGGVVANGDAEVLTNDDEVVPGLYAAGEVTATNGIFKESFIFGRIAGAEAAEFVQQ